MPESDLERLSPDDRMRELLKQARVAGLRSSSPPTMQSVERRRIELWTLMFVVVVGTCLALVLSAGDLFFELGVQSNTARPALAALAVLFCAYAIEKEVRLRRVAALLVDERVLSASLRSRVDELSAVLAAGCATNAVLEVSAVLERILDSALGLLGGEGGSVMLMDGPAHLKAVAVHGNPAANGVRIRIGEGFAGRVADTREPLLLDGRVKGGGGSAWNGRESAPASAMSVPLLHRDELLGVLNVSAPPARRYGEDDLRTLRIFAEQAATAVANARLYAAEQQHVSRLLELDRLKADFVTAVNHDLRTPLTLIIGGAALLRRTDITDEQRERCVAAMEKHAHRLAAMIDTVLATTELDAIAHPVHIRTVDVVAVAHQAAADAAAKGWCVGVVAPSAAPVLADSDGLLKALRCIIDNAFTHGAPPVNVSVHEEAEGVVVTVTDAGAGIPAEDRERVFDRFVRLKPAERFVGIGLGLSVASGLIQACGGSIRIDDAEDGGTAVRMVLEPAPAVVTAETETETAGR